jgi:hypothetical protein
VPVRERVPEIVKSKTCDPRLIQNGFKALLHPVAFRVWPPAQEETFVPPDRGSCRKWPANRF